VRSWRTGTVVSRPDLSAASFTLTIILKMASPSLCPSNSEMTALAPKGSRVSENAIAIDSAVT